MAQKHRAREEEATMIRESNSERRKRLYNEARENFLWWEVLSEANEGLTEISTVLKRKIETYQFLSMEERMIYLLI